MPRPAPGAERRVGRLLSRPEAGALAGVVVVWGVFAVLAGRPFLSGEGAAAYLNAAAPLGIITVPVTLLMIAGEFDLSVGSVVGAAGMTVALLAGFVGWPLWAAIAAALVLAGAIGLVNGLVVTRTGLPSFIVTLGTLFMVRGLTIGASRLLTGRTQMGGLEATPGYASARLLFATQMGPYRVSIAWWAVVAVAGAWALHRTRWGNGVRAAGGNAEAARNVGVPVARLKVQLFVLAALASGLVAVLQAVRYTGADVLRGEQQEFRAIVAAVIGGTLLTGGYGSVLGAALGALLFGMVQQGLVLVGVDADWFQLFLGAMLLAAVLFNAASRRRALAGRPHASRPGPAAGPGAAGEASDAPGAA